MEIETLNDKIVYALDGRMHCKDCRGHALKELNEAFKDFIQKLKEGFREFDMVFKLNIVDDMIDKLAGDALIYSPELAKKTGTPDDMGICNPGNSSGTHSQQGKSNSQVGTGRKPAGTTHKIGCTNLDLDEDKVLFNWMVDVYGKRCLDFAEGCPCCEGWILYDKLIQEEITDNQDCTKCGSVRGLHPIVMGCQKFVPESIPSIPSIPKTTTTDCEWETTDNPNELKKTTKNFNKKSEVKADFNGSHNQDCCTKSKGCGKRIGWYYKNNQKHKPVLCGDIKNKLPELCSGCDNQNYTNSKSKGFINKSKHIEKK